MPGCLNCGKPSTLKCPTCAKKELPDAHYCSQDCFKKSWALHKLVHGLTPVKQGKNEILLCETLFGGYLIYANYILECFYANTLQETLLSLVDSLETWKKSG